MNVTEVCHRMNDAGGIEKTRNGEGTEIVTAMNPAAISEDVLTTKRGLTDLQKTGQRGTELIRTQGRIWSAQNCGENGIERIVAALMTRKQSVIDTATIDVKG